MSERCSATGLVVDMAMQTIKSGTKKTPTFLMEMFSILKEIFCIAINT